MPARGAAVVLFMYTLTLKNTVRISALIYADEFASAAKTEQFLTGDRGPATAENPTNAAVIAMVTSGSVDGAGKSGVSLDDTSLPPEFLNPVLAAPFEEGFSGGDHAHHVHSPRSSRCWV